MFALLMIACGSPPPPPEPAPEPEPVAAPPPSRMTSPTPVRAFDTPPPLPVGVTDPYVAEGVCARACCTWGEWTVTTDTPVLDAPGGAEIARLVKDEKARVKAGKLVSHPQPARVTREAALGGENIVRLGEVVWVLGPADGALWRVWSHGQVVTTEANFVTEARCDGRSTDECWAAFDRPATPDFAAWWVEVELKGRSGWVDNSKDALTGPPCG